MPTFRYEFYSLRIDSAFDLRPLKPVVLDKPADVHIRLGHVQRPALQAALKAIGPYLCAGPEQLLLQVPDVAWYHIEDGKQITIDRYENADAASINTFLFGSALGALLMQRGYLVLHGNAIAVGGTAMVCVGGSGAGKSSVAACLASRGYSVFADDVVLVDPQGQVLPGMPHIKLWQDVADHLGIDTDGLQPVRPDLQKFYWPMAAQAFAAKPLAISHVFHLIPDGSKGLELSSVTGVMAFKYLAAQVYRRRFMKGMGLTDKLMMQAARLAQQAHVIEVRRPPSLDGLKPLADALIALLVEQPVAADEGSP